MDRMKQQVQPLPRTPRVQLQELQILRREQIQEIQNVLKDTEMKVPLPPQEVQVLQAVLVQLVPLPEVRGLLPEILVQLGVLQALQPEAQVQPELQIQQRVQPPGLQVQLLAHQEGQPINYLFKKTIYYEWFSYLIFTAIEEKIN
jgi:hypothetical protein